MKKKEIKEIKERISKLREYYSKNVNLFENNEKEEKEDKFYPTTYAQREKIISEYLIEKEKANLPGISYDIKDQNSYINFLKTEGFTDKEIKNLFSLIIENDNDFIIELNQLISGVFIPIQEFPDFKTYIIGRLDNKGFLLDYSKHKTVKLEDENEFYIIFDEFKLNKKFYSLSLFTNFIKNDVIINILKKK